jgi:hypothetical protein
MGIMKLGELMQRAGAPAIWPARWVESLGPDEASAPPEDGVLEGLSRLGSRLFLRINVQGHQRTASLEWDGPPAVGAVETVLAANIGVRIRDLGSLELPGDGNPPQRPAA